MKKIKAHYYVSTRYVGSDIEEDVEIEVPKEATKEEIEDLIQIDFEEWVWNTISASWNYESD